MSYSNNVKNLILTLVKQGRSPEETIRLLSEQILNNEEKSYSYFKELANSLFVPFSSVDCREIYASLPSPKTIRYWVAKEPKSKNQTQFDPEKIEAELIDFSNSQGKYPEEWEHYNKIKEAIIKLQHVCEGQIGELLDLITRERVTLDDSQLQNHLDRFMAAIQECTNLDMSIPHDLITPVITRTSERMNRRYKRN